MKKTLLCFFSILPLAFGALMLSQPVRAFDLGVLCGVGCVNEYDICVADCKDLMDIEPLYLCVGRCKAGQVVCFDGCGLPYYVY